MGKVTPMFGSHKEGGQPPDRDVRELVAPLSAPAVQLVLASENSSSFFGGSPAIDFESQWPCKDGRPLTFLAMLDLESLARVNAFEWLPSNGSLLFFFDVESQPWGFDPKDAGSWAVNYLPEGPRVSGKLQLAPTLPKKYFKFHRIQTFPSWERPEVQSLQLSDEESDDLADLANSSFGGEAAHQVGGFPSPIQGDGMELECQLASNGIYCGDSSGYESPKANQLEDGAKDWRLLLQIASDDALDTMWGDSGNLYFWIRDQDARSRQFDRAWTILQCY